MGLFRRVLIGVLVVIGLAVAGAYLLPRHVVVEREIAVAAPPEAVFDHINSLQAFSQWSPWSAYDPDMVVAYSGPETGVGNVMEWTSEHRNVGNGRQEIVSVVENQEVRTLITFDGMGDAMAWWVLVPEGDGTRVTWGFDADMGNTPIARWMGLMMDGFVGADYERGLSQLQATVEG